MVLLPTAFKLLLVFFLQYLTQNPPRLDNPAMDVPLLGGLSVFYSLMGKDPVTISLCEIGSNTIIVDLDDMPDLDTDLDSSIIVMDSTSNQLQKL